MVHLRSLCEHKVLSQMPPEMDLVSLTSDDSFYVANDQMQKCDPASLFNDDISTTVVKAYFRSNFSPNPIHFIAITGFVYCSAVMPLIGVVVCLTAINPICKARCARSHRSSNIPCCCPICNCLGTASHSILGQSIKN
jgi:hypothetical protein